MRIIHFVDDFLKELFPEINLTDKNSIIATFEKYYTYQSIKPIVKFDNNIVEVNIDTKNIINQEKDFSKVISYCEKADFPSAKPILAELINKNPCNSEYYRIMGQILSEEGNQEEAINNLIDALRWDSKNGYALVMMGNIFAKYKDDIETARKYYDQALIANSKDNITVNNIGGNLLSQGKNKEAEEYFKKALSIDSKYPNTHYGLSMVSEKNNDLDAAFENIINALKTNKQKNDLYKICYAKAFDLAQNLAMAETGKKIYRAFRSKLEVEGNMPIDIIKDETIPTSAKIEFAENYNRDRHIIKFNPKFQAIEHLIMHELVHLELVINARKINANQLFISDQTKNKAFFNTYDSYIKKLSKQGFSESSIENVMTSLFEGINRQIFNAPIDLFIEDYLYTEYPSLRPYQFISVNTIVQEGLKAVTDKNILELCPSEIVSISKTYNIVGAMQLNTLFGIDYISLYKASNAELKTSTDFYSEYKEYKVDKEPAEEYELIQNWAEDLGLTKYFELVGENQFRKRTNIDTLLTSIEEDPYDIADKDPFKEREMAKFQKSQKSIGTNMAVVMFMVDALQYFDKQEASHTKKVAMEIAILGTQGLNPEKKDYQIDSIKGKKFSGYHILAYYYVSWAIAIPNMLSQLQLPYDDEYSLAKQMHKPTM
jgi:tetratricopeptide (TPR) repeat protein